MKLQYVPLLGVQRGLYQRPVGRERFQAYLAAMLDGTTGDLKLPLAAMNPMAKPQVANRIEELLMLGAEDIGEQTTAEAERNLAEVVGEFRIALVLADDVAGSWTERYASEFSRRFATQTYQKRGWIEAGLWASEVPTPASIAECVRCAIYRAVYIQQHGFAQTLGEMLAQEGEVARAVGCVSQTLSADELAHTENVIAPRLAAMDRPTVMTCLFGDEAATALGYAPLELKYQAGLRLAYKRAQHQDALCW